MIKAVSITLAAVALSACASKPPHIYWGNYSGTLYNYKKEPSEATRADHVEQLEYIIARSESWQIAPPPGVCAELGKLYIDMGQPQKGIAMLNREVELYPESQPLITMVLKQVQ
jgi:hypothetical protein